MERVGSTAEPGTRRGLDRDPACGEFRDQLVHGRRLGRGAVPGQDEHAAGGGRAVRTGSPVRRRRDRCRQPEHARRQQRLHAPVGEHGDSGGQGGLERAALTPDAAVQRRPRVRVQSSPGVAGDGRQPPVDAGQDPLAGHEGDLASASPEGEQFMDGGLLGPAPQRPLAPAEDRAVGTVVRDPVLQDAPDRLGAAHGEAASLGDVPGRPLRRGAGVGRPGVQEGSDRGRVAHDQESAGPGIARGVRGDLHGRRRGGRGHETPPEAVQRPLGGLPPVAGGDLRGARGRGQLGPSRQEVAHGPGEVRRVPGGEHGPHPLLPDETGLLAQVGHDQRQTRQQAFTQLGGHRALVGRGGKQRAHARGGGGDVPRHRGRGHVVDDVHPVGDVELGSPVAQALPGAGVGGAHERDVDAGQQRQGVHQRAHAADLGQLADVDEQGDVVGQAQLGAQGQALGRVHRDLRAPRPVDHRHGAFRQGVVLAHPVGQSVRDGDDGVGLVDQLGLGRLPRDALVHGPGHHLAGQPLVGVVDPRHRRQPARGAVAVVGGRGGQGMAVVHVDEVGREVDQGTQEAVLVVRDQGPDFAPGAGPPGGEVLQRAPAPRCCRAPAAPRRAEAVQATGGTAESAAGPVGQGVGRQPAHHGLGQARPGLVGEVPGGHRRGLLGVQHGGPVRRVRPGGPVQGLPRQVPPERHGHTQDGHGPVPAEVERGAVRDAHHDDLVAGAHRRDRGLLHARVSDDLVPHQHRHPGSAGGGRGDGHGTPSQQGQVAALPRIRRTSRGTTLSSA